MEEEKKEQEKSLEQLLKEAITNKDFINKLAPEELKHWDNIITGILELAKIQKENLVNTNNYFWAILLMFLLGGEGLLGNWGSTNITTNKDGNTSN